MTESAPQNRRAPVSAPTMGRPGQDGPPAALWLAVLDRLQRESPQRVRGWFRRLRPRQLHGGVLTLDVENEAQAAFLDTHCRDALAAAAQQATGRLISFAFLASASLRAFEPGSAPGGVDAPRLDPWMTFGAFAAGPCTRLAAAAANAFAAETEPSFRLLYLHGARGSGKTHLLQAICHSIAASARMRWRFVAAETFCREWIEAIETGDERAFRQMYRELDCLALDDLDALANRDRSQEEFFHTLNALQDLQTRIAVTATAAPSELSGIEPRLRDRLAAGFIAPLELPCRETRAALVRSLARARCIDIADPAIAVLAEPEGLSGTDLAAALTWLDAQSRTSGGRITDGLAREWVATEWVAHLSEVGESNDGWTARRRPTPTALRPPAQGCRDAATLGQGARETEQPQRGCAFFLPLELNGINAGNGQAATPLGSVIDRLRTQGSAFGATLGCGSKPLRGKCKTGLRPSA